MIAILGTGIMGLPMVRNLRAAGLEVRARNRTRARAEPLAGAGPEDARERCRPVFDAVGSKTRWLAALVLETIEGGPLSVPYAARKAER